jgi:protease-4
MSDNNGREWQLLEKAVTLASVDEQRKARRWGIFFKLLTFTYIFVIIIMVTSPSKSGKSARSKH